VTAAGKYGSTIREYKIECAGYTITGAESAKDIPLSQYDFGSGLKKLVITVTDTRGQTATREQNITILDYAPPEITGFSVLRLQNPATTIELKKTAKISSLKNGTTEKNTYTITTRYKRSDATAWTNAKVETNTSANFTLTAFAIDASYDFEVIVADKFNSTKVSASVSTTKVLMDFFEDKGVGFGKMYENGHGAVDVNGDIWLNGRHLYDMFIPVGEIKLSETNVNPGTYLPGTTWERYAPGKALIAYDPSDPDFNVVGKEGGGKSYVLRAAIGAFNSGTENVGYEAKGKLPNINYTYGGKLSEPGGPITNSRINHSTPVYGPDGNNLKVLPPYKVVYAWRRTA